MHQKLQAKCNNNILFFWFFIAFPSGIPQAYATFDLIGDVSEINTNTCVGQIMMLPTNQN